MRKIFNSPFKVTQGFGVNKAYYSQFGLAGHEGLDLIPTGSDWTVLALEDGVVVKDIDMASRGGAYGNHVTIWHSSINKATMYCHLASNSVSIDQQVKKGQAIGVMGATGNTQGAHVHLNLFDVDDNGVRLNKDNGYLGGIDPLPFLNEGGVDMDELAKAKAEADQNRKDRDKWYNELQAEKAKTAQLTKELEAEKNKPTTGSDLKAEALKTALRNFLS